MSVAGCFLRRLGCGAATTCLHVKPIPSHLIRDRHVRRPRHNTTPTSSRRSSEFINALTSDGGGGEWRGSVMWLAAEHEGLSVRQHVASNASCPDTQLVERAGALKTRLVSTCHLVTQFTRTFCGAPDNDTGCSEQTTPERGDRLKTWHFIRMACTDFYTLFVEDDKRALTQTCSWDNEFVFPTKEVTVWRSVEISFEAWSFVLSTAATRGGGGGGRLETPAMSPVET
ncbi:hypothetical protein LSAT2_016002 [Lamellibrachia satsuma]|nr:hypothetical protein LSAT2_016002 [Lamellibrachia satsuma]